jgi:hypothetical protein
MDIATSIAATHAARGLLGLLRPHDVVGARKTRIGRAFDGGYVMIDAFDEVEAVYSLGINDDVSWDAEMAARGLDIHQYDHTIDGLPEENARFHWNRIGIAERSGDGMTSLADALAANGHAQARNLLLKCDIECAEWTMLRHTPQETLSCFSQIVLELHDLCRLGDGDDADVRQAVAALTASHHVVHVHANNYGGVQVVGGFMLPNVVELTLLRKDMGEFRPSTTTFPTPLDMPCAREWADIYLGNFAFS